MPFLATLRAKKRLYQERSPVATLPGNVLIVVWFGANDIITAPRDPEGARTVAAEVVREAADLVEKVWEVELGLSRMGNIVRCMIGNVPDVNAMPRFFGQSKMKQAKFDQSRIAFNDALENAIATSRQSDRRHRVCGNVFNYLGIADIEQTSFLQMDYLSDRGIVPVKSPGGFETL